MLTPEPATLIVIQLNQLKFRLSTLLLAFTCFALSLGWYFDRRRDRDRMESALDGAVIWNESLRLEHLAGSDQSKLSEIVKHGQIHQIILLFRFSDDLEEFNDIVDDQQMLRHPNDSGKNYKLAAEQFSAPALAAELLADLECESADDYFGLLENWVASESEFLAGGGKHEEFRRFVDNAIGWSN